jgi:integrase
VSGQTPILKLTKSDLKTFVSRFEGIKGSSINRYLGAVMAMLHAAGEYFPELEDWNPPHVRRMTEGPGRERVLTGDEIARLLAALKGGRQRLERFDSAKVKGEVYDLLRMMLLTGAREGELMKLEQSAINWNWRTLQIDATKTKTIRVLPLSDTALEILQSRYTGKQHFFSINYHQLWRTLKKVCPLADLTIGQSAAGGWVFYDLRHTAASVMELNGVSYSTVSKILGHKRGDMTAHYTHATLESMRHGLQVLEKWCLEIDGFCLGFRENQSTPEKAAHLAG